MTLNREQLRELIEEQGLIQNYVHLDTQLTPQGFDLTAAEIHRYEDSGKLDFSNDEREVPESTPIQPEKKNQEDEYGWWELEQGTYKVVMNEKVDIPNNLVGYAYPRSSLLRMGVTIENAVWDSGFTGTGSFKISVDNSEGVEIKENARLNQIVFEKIRETEEGYSGVYHEE
ncbi:MAG: dUTP pyrophosphatase [Candidatus Nanohaloarchaea archaeon]|jgi:dUTP pyrophosphatase